MRTQPTQACLGAKMVAAFGLASRHFTAIYHMFCNLAWLDSVLLQQPTLHPINYAGSIPQMGWIQRKERALTQSVQAVMVAQFSADGTRAVTVGRLRSKPDDLTPGLASLEG